MNCAGRRLMSKPAMLQQILDTVTHDLTALPLSPSSSASEAPAQRTTNLPSFMDPFKCICRASKRVLRQIYRVGSLLRLVVERREGEHIPGCPAGNLPKIGDYQAVTITI